MFQLRKPTSPEVRGGRSELGLAVHSVSMVSIAAKPESGRTLEASGRAGSPVGECQRTCPSEFLISVPRVFTPTKLYRDQTPWSADSRRKVPARPDPNFSYTVSGVSLAEKTVRTSGMIRYSDDRSITRSKDSEFITPAQRAIEAFLSEGFYPLLRKQHYRQRRCQRQPRRLA